MIFKLFKVIRILICDSIHKEGIETLKRAGFIVDVKSDISGKELRAIISNYDAVIVRSRTKVTNEVIDKGCRLKAIGRVGVGLDNVDLCTAKTKDVAVFNAPEAPAEAVAELTIGLIISLARSIPFADRAMKEGKWVKKQLVGWQLEGKTLGLLGLGNIGKRVAKIAKSFGMRILFTKRTPPDPKLLTELEGELVPLKTMLTHSDVVTIHVPLNPTTHQMIGWKELSLMKNGTYLINTSRSAIVDEKALLEAIYSGKLKGAALDVYEVEPPRNLELVKLPNVICTPHIGGQTEESQREASTIIANKIITHLKDSMP